MGRNRSAGAGRILGRGRGQTPPHSTDPRGGHQPPPAALASDIAPAPHFSTYLRQPDRESCGREPLSTTRLFSEPALPVAHEVHTGESEGRVKGHKGEADP